MIACCRCCTSMDPVSRLNLSVSSSLGMDRVRITQLISHRRGEGRVVVGIRALCWGKQRREAVPTGVQRWTHHAELTGLQHRWGRAQVCSGDLFYSGDLVSSWKMGSGEEKWGFQAQRIVALSLGLEAAGDVGSAHNPGSLLRPLSLRLPPATTAR